LSGTDLCDELITRPEESYRLCCVVVSFLETSRMGAPYIYDISHLRINNQLISQPQLTLSSNVTKKYGILLSFPVSTSRNSRRIINGCKTSLVQRVLIFNNFSWALPQNCGERLLPSSCLSVCPHGTARLPLDGF